MQNEKASLLSKFNQLIKGKTKIDCKIVKKLGENYKNKLEKFKEEEPIIETEANIGNYEECKKFNENLAKGLDK